MNNSEQGMTPDNIEGHLNSFRDGYNAAMAGNPSGLQDWEGIAKTIMLSIDHYREAGRDDNFNVQSIADYLKRCFSPPSQPSGLQWVKVNERLPKHSSLVVIKFKNGNPATALFQDKETYHFSWLHNGRAIDGEVDVWLDESTPPFQPLGIEELRKKCADFIGTVDNCSAFEIFMAGYAASPQSSTEEEKVEIIDGYTQLMVDRRSLPKDGQRIKFMTENENWYEGYFVGGDDIFHVSDSQFFFKWHVQQWKAI